ncbi:MAG TPA: CPXCG motif-containing cysteine-rich protein [Chthoniobacterales bacterium]|nr:CPXCG motif-containing cysteine-rich protein [Chthoniobacterales bacterium]
MIARVPSKMEFLVETEITCPHCGEVFPLQIDTSQSKQSLIEDCAVCCQPITLRIRSLPGVVVDLTISI